MRSIPASSGLSVYESGLVSSSNPLTVGRDWLKIVGTENDLIDKTFGKLWSRSFEYLKFRVFYKWESRNVLSYHL